MPFKKRDIEQLLAATGRKCVICRSLHNVQVHHIVPKEQGGTDTIGNAVPLCPSCHDRVHVKPSSGRTTRDYTPQEVRLHRNRMISMCRRNGHDWDFGDTEGPAASTHDDPCAIDQQLKISRVSFATAARADCRTMQINEADARSFVRDEATRHPLMFHRPFSSLPLVFADNVLLLSWDGKAARIERLLTRQQAYPLNDQWATCLALYRKATLLPYRTQGTGMLVTSSDAKVALALFRRLVDQSREYIRQAQAQGTGGNKGRFGNIGDMERFLDEAQFALVNADRGVAIARLEAVLSTVHKLILRHAPQGVGVERSAMAETPPLDPQKAGKPTILLVDDHPLVRDALTHMFEREGYQCYTATCSRDALQILVERDFDLIVTDLMMPDADGLNATMDGRELVLAAKKSGTRAKIVVLTCYSEMALKASAGSEKFPCDFFVEKVMAPDELLNIVHSVLDSPSQRGHKTEHNANKAIGSDKK